MDVPLSQAEKNNDKESEEIQKMTPFFTQNVSG